MSEHQVNENLFFIESSLSDFGVEFQVLTNSDGNYQATGKISLEKVEFKNLGKVVNLFNELEDCVR